MPVSLLSAFLAEMHTYVHQDCTKLFTSSTDSPRLETTQMSVKTRADHILHCIHKNGINTFQWEWTNLHVTLTNPPNIRNKTDQKKKMHTLHNSIYIKNKSKPTQATLSKVKSVAVLGRQNLGVGTRGSRMLAMVCFLICMLVTWVCANNETSQSRKFTKCLPYCRIQV